MFKRYLISFIGIIVYALAINNLLALNFGERPQDLLIIFFENLFNYHNYANVYFVVELFFLLLLIIFMRKLKSNWHEIIISFISIIALSRLISFLSPYTFDIHGVLAFIAIMLFVNLGLSLIAVGNMIITPLDKFLLHISMNIRLSYGLTRLVFDLTIFTLVIILNILIFEVSVLNLASLIIIFTSGPIIHLYEVIFNKFMDKRNN